MRWSVALVHARVDLRHAHLLLDVMDPVVVDDIGLGWSREAEDGGGQSAGDHGGKSELLHFDAFFFFCLSDVSSAGLVLPLRRSDGLNQEVRALIPVAGIDRRLAGIDHISTPRRAFEGR
jgi:hypothetical protein